MTLESPAAKPGGSSDVRWDYILEHYLGSFGLYQKWMYFFLCIPAIYTAFPPLLPVFVNGEQLHRCAIPKYTDDTYSNQSAEHQISISRNIPPALESESYTYSQCTLYKTNGSLKNGGDKNRTKNACDAWVYETSFYQLTVVSDFDLVCDDTILQSHLTMMYYGGVMFGSALWGFGGDIIGRKKTLFLSIALMFVFNLACAWAPNFEVYGALRFVAGIANVGYWTGGFILGQELVGPSKRKWTGFIVEIFWCAGELILCGAAYGIRNWRHLQIVLSASMSLLLVFWFIIPESPRWLLSKGRQNEAKAIMHTAAKMNRVKIPDDLDLTLEQDVTKPKQIEILKEFVTSRDLMIRGIVVLFIWIVINVGYFGLTLNVGRIGGNVYINFTASSLVELVAYVVCLALLDRIGRKVLMCSSMILGGVACLMTIFTSLYASESLQWTTIALSMIGKMGVSAAFGVMYVYTTELFPTSLRSFVIGVANIGGRIGALISPYIADLSLLVSSEFGKALPLVIFGSLSLAAGITALSLPETMDKELPETVEEACQLGRKVTTTQETARQPEEENTRL